MPMECQATNFHCAIPFHADACSAVAGPQAASCSAVVAVGCKSARDFPRFLRDSQAQRSLLIRPRALASVNDLTQIARFPCGATGIVLLLLCYLFQTASQPFAPISLLEARLCRSLRCVTLALLPSVVRLKRFSALCSRLQRCLRRWFASSEARQS